MFTSQTFTEVAKTRLFGERNKKINQKRDNFFLIKGFATETKEGENDLRESRATKKN